MNNTPLNQDNIISAVARISLRTQKSSKTGNDFTILSIRFKNGLEIDYFVDKRYFRTQRRDFKNLNFTKGRFNSKRG